MRRSVAAMLMVVALACARPAPLPVVPDLDLARYQGRWYEIASFPTRFQRGCVGTTAEYTLLPDGDVRVVNACRDGPDGPVRRIEGRAFAAGNEGEAARLRVRFFWPFSGAYDVIALDPDYRFALVGNPSREYLWILSRTPALPEETIDALRDRAAALGFDVMGLVRTAQP